MGVRGDQAGSQGILAGRGGAGRDRPVPCKKGLQGRRGRGTKSR